MPSLRHISTCLTTALHQTSSHLWAILPGVRTCITAFECLLLTGTLGGLCILAGLELKRLNLPQPAATILISPWIDMALKAYRGGNPAVESDYFLVANKAVPALVSLFIGDRSPDSPDVNPLYCRLEELKGLSPQLIFAGGAEFARYDSEKWAEMCHNAGVYCKLTIEWAQLHIYAVGSRFTHPAVRRKTDGMIIEWIKTHVAQ